MLNELAIRATVLSPSSCLPFYERTQLYDDFLYFMRTYQGLGSDTVLWGATSSGAAERLVYSTGLFRLDMSQLETPIVEKGEADRLGKSISLLRAEARLAVVDLDASLEKAIKSKAPYLDETKAISFNEFDLVDTLFSKVSSGCKPVHLGIHEAYRLIRSSSSIITDTKSTQGDGDPHVFWETINKLLNIAQIEVVPIRFYDPILK